MTERVLEAFGDIQREDSQASQPTLMIPTASRFPQSCDAIHLQLMPHHQLVLARRSRRIHGQDHKPLDGLSEMCGR